MKGFTEERENVEKKAEPNGTNPTPLQMKTKPSFKREKSNTNSTPLQTKLKPELDEHPQNRQSNKEQRISIQNFVTGDLQELDEKVKSMMEKSQNLDPSGKGRARICRVCGKEGQSMTIRDHIESNHLEGVTLPCNICEKTFR